MTEKPTAPVMTDPELETPPPLVLDAHERRILRRARVLLVVMLAVLLSAVGYVLYARGVFEPTQTLVLLAEDSEGVRNGMDLTYSGFAIGRVQRFALNADGKVEVVVKVRKKEARWLRETSVFTLEKGLIGEAKLRVFTGIMSDPPLPDGARRNVLRGDINENLPRILAQAHQLLGNLNEITATESQLQLALANLQTFTQALNGKTGALGAILGGDAPARQVMGTLVDAQKALQSADALITGLQQRLLGQQGLADDAQKAIRDLQTVLGQTSTSLKKVDALLVDAQAIAGNTREASEDLVALRAQVEVSLRRAEQLLAQVRKLWPLSGGGSDAEIKLP